MLLGSVRAERVEPIVRHFGVMLRKLEVTERAGGESRRPREGGLEHELQCGE